jgi:hypothetical protein
MIERARDPRRACREAAWDFRAATISPHLAHLAVLFDSVRRDGDAVKLKLYLGRPGAPPVWEG